MKPSNTAKVRPARVRVPLRVLVMVTGVFVVLALCLVLFAPRPFDEGVWSQAREAKNYRLLYAMSDSLVARLIKTRPSQAEVVRLLGPADRTFGAIHRYKLGSHWNRPMPIYWTLDIAYDEKQEHAVFVKLIPD